MFASISFGAGLLSNQRTQSVERASYPIISYLLKALLVEFVKFKSLVLLLKGELCFGSLFITALTWVDS
ncbi:hypothetical protein B9J90_13730 [Vibrio sp. V09_P4A23P171]|nr:hypothetical protein B9J90_13730 [Vibrio sp. V09_P4A23P171]